MAQFYDVLSPTDKGQEQQFYNNVEEQTVQYVITPEKTQVQYPQQIVVTTGEQISQLMVVDAQPQQILIDQSTITYQGQAVQQQTQVQQTQVPQQQVIQQQVVPQQVQQFAVIQDGTLNNGTQQIFFMDSNNTTERVVVETQGSPQPIVLNHQIGQTSIRLARPAQSAQQVVRASRQPVLQQPRPQARLPVRSPNPNPQPPRPINATNQVQTRTTTPGQVQLRTTSPNQTPVRQQSPNPAPVRQQNPNQQQPLKLPMGSNQVKISTPQNQQQPLRSMTRIPTQQFRPQSPGQLPVRQSNQQVRQLVSGQQIRVNSPTVVQQRIPGQIVRTPGVVGVRFPNLQQLQAKASTQDIDLTEEIKPSDEQNPATLPDGSTVSIASYKKLFNDIKNKIMQQKANLPNANTSASPPAAIPTVIPALIPAVVQTPTSTPKRRNPPKPRQPAKQSTAAQRNAKTVATNIAQFGAPVQQQQPQQINNNDPSRYAMMNQGQSPQQQITKQPPAPFPQQQQQLQQQQQPPLQQPKPSQANYVIQPPKMNQKPQQRRPLPAYIPSSQIQKIIESTPISEEFSDSIRMLVLLENGEQRLITFTLPKEACTIQEILEQVNVPFQSNTNIQVTEANSSGINYIVTVGNVHTLGIDDDDVSMPEEPVPPLLPPPTPPNLSMSPPPPPPPALLQATKQTVEIHIPGPASPEQQDTPKDIPKYVPGMWALCGMCGYLSEDFAKCIRCQRKLPDTVKAIPATVKNGPKREPGPMPQLVQQQGQQQPGNLAIAVPSNSTGNPKSNPSNSPKKKSAKSKSAEIESVHVISSDEEDEEKPSKVSPNILQKLGASVTICPISKEPSPNDIQRLCAALKSKVSTVPESQETSNVSTTVICRTVRIGSYRCIPFEKKVIVDSKQVLMKVPHPSNEKQLKTIKIEKKDVIKVLASFNIALPVFFYYLNPDLATTIREELCMTADGDYYYDPLSTEEEAFRRITLLPDDVGDNDKDIFQTIYGGSPNLIDELNVKEANDILIKTCPKDLTRAPLGMGSFTEIKQLLTYPPEGRGRISINTEDYVCLAQDQFLNDVIIDFYLKYLVEHLPEEQKPKVHVFSTFFYKRLTTKPVKASRKSQPSELDPSLTAAQKRHARVKTWTKNVNLFEKDFIIVPINENAHWFLAIICYPGLDGPETWDGKPYVVEVKKKKKKSKSDSTPNTTVTVKQEKEKPIVCEDPEQSDKDEAEGDDSELESDDSEELPLSQSSTNSSAPSESPTTPVIPPAVVAPPAPTTPAPRVKKEPRPPIKQPCILIFDSLAGANRSRVVATLRDYLTCEHMAKIGKEKIYNRDIIKGANPKVPQQNNFTDCGLYVLQYVEQFFKDPIKDYHMPIKQIQNWFEEIVVTKKREDIAILIKSLMKKYGKDTRILPEIIFPTLNGKLVEREFDEEEEEEEEMMEDEEEPNSPTGATHDSESDIAKEESFITLKSMSPGETLSGSEDGKSEETSSSPEKPLSHASSGDFVTQTVVDLKPDLREFPRQSSKDTLSILKAKRIIRHKNADGPEVKKLKSD